MLTTVENVDQATEQKEIFECIKWHTFIVYILRTDDECKNSISVHQKLKPEIEIHSFIFFPHGNIIINSNNNNNNNKKNNNKTEQE